MLNNSKVVCDPMENQCSFTVLLNQTIGLKKRNADEVLILELHLRNCPLKEAPMVKNVSEWCYLITHNPITLISKHLNLNLQIIGKPSRIKKDNYPFCLPGARTGSHCRQSG